MRPESSSGRSGDLEALQAHRIHEGHELWSPPKGTETVFADEREQDCGVDAQSLTDPGGDEARVCDHQ